MKFRHLGLASKIPLTPSQCSDYSVIHWTANPQPQDGISESQNECVKQIISLSLLNALDCELSNK